jgi:hypothetical protein
LNSLNDIQTTAAVWHVKYTYGFWTKQASLCRIMSLMIKCGSFRIREENNTPINDSILIHFGLKWCSMKNISKVTALFHQISFHTQPKPLKIIHCAQCICFIFGHSFFHYWPGHGNYIAQKLCIHCDVPQL